MGAFLGRKPISYSSINRAGSTMRNVSRVRKESGDVERAQDNLEILRQQLDDLHNRFQEEIEIYTQKYSASKEELVGITIRPLKSNISVQLFGFVWVPFWMFADGMVAKG